MIFKQNSCSEMIFGNQLNVNKPRTIYAQSSCKKRVLAHFVSSKNLPWFQDSSWILPQKSRSILTLITKTIFGALWKQPWFQGNSGILPWFQRNSSDIFITCLDFKATWIFHSVSLASSEESVKIILLNHFLVTPSGFYRCTCSL